MARFTSLGIPPPPKERDYPQDSGGGFAYTRDAIEWLQGYVDATDDHRKDSFDMVGNIVHEHEAALLPESSRNPGWVANAIVDIRAVHDRFVAQVAEDNAALLEDNRRIRKQLKWQNGLALTALVSMLIFLGQQLIVKGSVA